MITLQNRDDPCLQRNEECDIKASSRNRRSGFDVLGRLSTELDFQFVIYITQIRFRFAMVSAWTPANPGASEVVPDPQSDELLILVEEFELGCLAVGVLQSDAQQVSMVVAAPRPAGHRGIGAAEVELFPQ